MLSEFLVESETITPGVLMLRVVGELDAATADHLVQTLEQWAGISECVIDLSNCTFVDSRGLTALLMCRRVIGESTPMRLIDPLPNVEHVLRIAGLQTYLGLDVPAA